MLAADARAALQTRQEAERAYQRRIILEGVNKRTASFAVLSEAAFVYFVRPTAAATTCTRGTCPAARAAALATSNHLEALRQLGQQN